MFFLELWKNLQEEREESFEKKNTTLGSRFGLKNQCFKLCLSFEKIRAWRSVGPLDRSTFKAT